MLKTVLKNGLTLIVEENHASRVVAVQAWVGVGSADELPAEAGLAHVQEHMLFKGTTRRRRGEITAAIEGAGGEINAATSFDHTVYYATIASREVDVALDILADAVQHSTFDPKELARELGVILEELHRGEDMPSRVASEMLFRAAYTAHPYFRPVIGYAETIRKFTREQVLAFHRRWYHPGNMCLVVVGDVKREDVLRRAETLFESRAELAPPTRPPPRPVEPPLGELRVVKKAQDSAGADLSFAWSGVALSHPDAPALEVLSTVLGGGERSRLARRVKREKALVHDCICSSYARRDPGLLVVSAQLHGGSVEVAYEELLRESLRLRHQEPDPSELERAKAFILADDLHQRETVQGVARKLGYCELVAGDAAFEHESMARLEGVTGEDVRRVATQYLDPERMVVSTLLPRAHAAAMSEEAVRGINRAVKATLEAQYAPWRMELGPEQVAKVRLSSGATLLVREDASAPLVNLCAFAQGGTLAEDAETNGVSHLVSELLVSGTERFTAEQILDETEAMAGALAGLAGRSSLGLRGDFPKRSFDRGLELFSSCLLEPTFSIDALGRAKGDQVAEIASRLDTPSLAVLDLFSAALYETHPYRLPPLGTEESVERLTRDDVVVAFRSQLSPERLTLAVVGPVEVARTIEAIERSIGTAAPFAGRRPITRPPRPEAPDTPRLKQLTHEKRQAHLMLGFLGVALDDDRRFELDVLSNVLGGQSGRLLLELRDERSLAYAVTAFYLEGLDPTGFAVYVATSREKLDAAERGIRAQLERVLSEEISENELRKAQRYLAGAYDLALQRASARASSMALNEAYGVGYDEYARYAARIAAVTPQRVREVARQIIRLDAPVRAIIAPERA